MPMDYDDNNIFARILRGDLPCRKVFENDHVLAFDDINPQAPVHVLVIPKGSYRTMDEFTRRGSAEEITAYMQALGAIVEKLNLTAKGYRLLVNSGVDGGQEVPHLHVHIFAGRPLGPMLAPDVDPPILTP